MGFTRSLASEFLAYAKIWVNPAFKLLRSRNPSIIIIVFKIYLPDISWESAG